VSKLGITVDLSNVDGNAFSILGAAGKAMRRAGIDPETRDEFMKEATSGDYDHLLVTLQEWMEVEL
jgi:hypothetical protein